jgi:hypothetical protein
MGPLARKRPPAFAQLGLELPSQDIFPSSTCLGQFSTASWPGTAFAPGRLSQPNLPRTAFPRPPGPDTPAQDFRPRTPFPAQPCLASPRPPPGPALPAQLASDFRPVAINLMEGSLKVRQWASRVLKLVTALAPPSFLSFVSSFFSPL